MSANTINFHIIYEINICSSHVSKHIDLDYHYREMVLNKFLQVSYISTVQ